MGKKAEYEKFEKQYSEVIKDMLVLTSESVGGAASYGKGMWTPSAGLLASIDLQTGALHEEGLLSWLVDESDRQRGGWIFDLQPLTIYHVKCREALRDGFHMRSCMLVEVVERDLHHPELDRILEAYMVPVEFTDDLCGTFRLEREFDWFSAEVDWLGETCMVALECDEENEETADDALEAFRKIYENIEEWDRQFRVYAAKNLTETANDWRDDEADPEPITEERFIGRICICEFTMAPEGDYTAYYDDDDMFGGHSITIEGNVDTGMERVMLEG